VFREKLSQSKSQLPEVHVDVDVGEENVGHHHQVRPVVASVNLLNNPSLTCVHNNEVIVVNISVSDKQVNNNSSGNVAV